jgi:hypothetical protein
MNPVLLRLKFAFSTFFAILLYDCIPARVAVAMRVAPARNAPAQYPPPQADLDDRARAAQLLAILQRDGRILDFLMEDITPYADAQIGAAARNVHTGCRQAIDRYVTLKPVIDHEEGATVTVESGADAATIKVIGNVAGQPPFRGVLRHRGWIATRIELPPLPVSGRMVIAPAEVEIP